MTVTTEGVVEQDSLSQALVHVTPNDHHSSNNNITKQYPMVQQTMKKIPEPLTNPIPLVRFLLKDFYIYLFQMFLPSDDPFLFDNYNNNIEQNDQASTNKSQHRDRKNHHALSEDCKAFSPLLKCEIVLQRTLMFVHYFHSSHLNRWLHFLTIIPFFSGLFLVLGVVMNGLFYGFMWSLGSACSFIQQKEWIEWIGETNVQLLSASKWPQIDWTLPLVILWSLLFIVFAMGIDRYAWIVLASFCMAIVTICSFFLLLSSNSIISIPSFSVTDLSKMSFIWNSWSSVSWTHSLRFGFSLWLFGFVSQAFVAHVVVDGQLPAFLVQEALLVTPIYMIMTCALMYNPCVEYLPKLRKEIEKHATRENFQKFGKIQK
ncbi:hypothetical protein FDP41_004310 [Naegleria fowleri]|uniref:Uncharacterized protein n=1 Tax=Naegleria fowleri TaxID=5763 RepID=A0A6A5BQA7_NAEFO|nr:uncharacterized protein FDP41_004310 [Naegleria fowleri]KAF0976411.1 hypothetical protein FDP41_004310 [Naegleria fowleri]CAG4717013.1 unnamed protein product [Naegleria fowleri]